MRNIKQWLVIILALALLVAVSVKDSHSDNKPKIEQIRIECFTTHSEMNYNLRTLPTVSKEGNRGEILHQYQVCRSA